MFDLIHVFTGVLLDLGLLTKRLVSALLGFHLRGESDWGAVALLWVSGWLVVRLLLPWPVASRSPVPVVERSLSGAGALL